MSTKTTFKRLALVAVASLGFGLLSAAPSSAAAPTVAGLVTHSFSTASVSVAVGATATTTYTIGGTAISAAAIVVTQTETFPADAAATAKGATAAGGTALTAATLAAQATAGGNISPTTTGTSGAFSASTVLSLTPDKPGTYTVTLTPAVATASSAGVAADPSVQVAAITFTVHAGYSIDPLRANRAFAVQGTNITSGWSGVDTGLVTARITGFSSSTTVRYYVTAQNGVIQSRTEQDTGDTLTDFENTNGANLADGFNFLSTNSTAGNAVDVQLRPAAGGTTASITVTSFNAATGVSTTHVVATASLGLVPAASAQYSTSIIAAGLDGPAAADAVGVSLARTAGVRAANITVTVRDQNTNILPTAGLAASITGPGLLSINPTDAVAAGDVGAARVVALTAGQAAANNGISNISVYADGTAGVATITITSGTTTLATETVTFFGGVATLEVTQNLSVARASAAGAPLGTSDTTEDGLTAATRAAVVIVALDANGNVVPGLTITGLSSNTAVIAISTVAQAAGAVDTIGEDGPGTYLASVTSAVGGVSGATATVTFRTQLATGAFISAPALTFTLGGLIATETISFDKASYEPGEAMVVTRTAVDSAGNPVFDGNAAPSITFNKAMGGAAIAASFYVGGVRATSATRPSVFAPVTPGVFTARATSGNLAATALTATATVGDDAATGAANAASDAAAEAIDAANAATDAANLAAEAADAATVAAEEARDAADAATAAVEALATEVATLMAALKAQITTLANTVAKIAKKVKA